jgi:dUTP pyrophosphatase
MKVKIFRIDKTLPLPEYQTKGSAAFDLYSRTDLEILPGQLGLIPTNLIIQTPKNYLLAVVPRSSTPKKLGLSIPHGLGIIDQDYCGPEDEIHVQLYNFTANPVKITRGQRFGQATFIRINIPKWQEIEEIKLKSRGGFGSTG